MTQNFITLGQVPAGNPYKPFTIPIISKWFKWKYWWRHNINSLLLWTLSAYSFSLLWCVNNIKVTELSYILFIRSLPPFSVLLRVKESGFEVDTIKGEVTAHDYIWVMWDNSTDLSSISNSIISIFYYINHNWCTSVIFNFDIVSFSVNFTKTISAHFTSTFNNY